LSPPHIGAQERELLNDALDSNWVAPLGPHVDAFERELAAYCGRRHAVALSSGTAALHLALLALGVTPGDEVVTSTLTFVATANAITYCGATPIFVDSSPDDWNMDPSLLAEAMEDRQKDNRPVRAVVAVDLYGQCADYPSLLSTCRTFDVPMVEDAAEALGGSRGGRAGSFGEVAALSFNGNKIITTSGGGMLLTDRSDIAERARHLSTQARLPFAHYEHDAVGYNYRLSNLLAALGRGQLAWLDDRVARKRAINLRYRAALGETPGIKFLPLANDGDWNAWLTCLLVDPAQFGCDRDHLLTALEHVNIEARPTWKPMHLQTVYAGAPIYGGGVAESIFRDGICLPSGSAMSDDDVDRVVDALLGARRA
jgi:dTDP-4-amino-4,6-dideoxygalactose transaminase